MITNQKKNQSGQVAILFALVFTFLFVILGFVVDFGHLINNKINLQIAADAAAYSGASWQANTLNRLSAINYRIRQDLKELSMRALVTHVRHNRNFPRGSQFINGNASAPQMELLMCQQAHGYRAISGRNYMSQTNLCRNAAAEVGGLPPIIVPPVIAAFDPLAIALRDQIRRIADEANKECAGAANDNEILARHLVNVYARRTRFHTDQMREITSWLNETGSGRLSEGDDHPIRKVAYESATRNLTRANKDEFEIEILPPNGNEFLRMESQSLNGSMLFIKFRTQGDGCIGEPGVLDFQMDSGMSKTQEIVTYFAVRLKARPKMMFMPQAWYDAAFPQIEAVAVAKPFGSRVGPPPSEDELLPTANRPGNASRLMNFSFIPQDKLGMMNTRLMALFDAVHHFREDSFRPDGNQQTGWPDAGKEIGHTALNLIQAPTIFDSVFYSVFPNPNVQNEYLEPEYAEALYPDYLEAAGPDGQIIQTREPATRPYWKNLQGNRGPGWIQVDARGSSPGGPYGSYADEGPDSHSLLSASALGIPYLNEGNVREFGFANKDMIHSGWAPPNEPGRIGYSVKIVSFDALFKSFVRLSSGGRGQIANLPVGTDYLKKVYH